MSIVLISEALLLRSTVSDGRILGNRVLCGFCVRMNARKRSFKVATSVAGKQFRKVLGYWHLMSVDEARALAADVLRVCRASRTPSKAVPVALPTLRLALKNYCLVKEIKASSQKRYDSLMRTHFGGWLDQPVSELGNRAFAEHCHYVGLNVADTAGALV